MQIMFQQRFQALSLVKYSKTGAEGDFTADAMMLMLISAPHFFFSPPSSDSGLQRGVQTNPTSEAQTESQHTAEHFV